LLADRFNAAKLRTITTREPGGSAGAEIVRHLLLSGMAKAFGPETESLLFAAARDDHVSQVIEPALAQGTWVLCDRFTDSTRVYQGELGKVDPKLIRAMERVTIGSLKPDLTIILDVPVAVGMERALKRRGTAAPDRFEGEGVSFHEKLRDAYLKIANGDPQRCALVDADADPKPLRSVSGKRCAIICFRGNDSRDISGMSAKSVEPEITVRRRAKPPRCSVIAMPSRPC
jgi:dTMP kinase